MSEPNKYTRTIVPAACKPGDDGSAAEYSGHIVVKTLSFDERMGVLEEFGVSEGDGASINESLQKAGHLKLGRFLAKKVEPLIVEVDLTRLDDGTKLTSWDDVMHETSLGGAVQEVAFSLIGRYRVGNVSAPS